MSKRSHNFMTDYFEIDRLVEDLAKIYSTACATTWFKIAKNKQPTKEEFRAKVVEFMTHFDYTLSVYPQVPEADHLRNHAKKILDAVSARFKSFKAIQAGFTYKVENGDGKAISTKKGTVYMKGTKYRVSFVGQEIFCDGNTVWTYDKSSNEVTISKLDASSNTLTPQKLFTDF